MSATITSNSALEGNVNGLGSKSFSNSDEEISKVATVQLSLRVVDKPKVVREQPAVIEV